MELKIYKHSVPFFCYKRFTCKQFIVSLTAIQRQRIVKVNKTTNVNTISPTQQLSISKDIPNNHTYYNQVVPFNLTSIYSLN
ncbi:hypothetical protein NWE55_08710 [Myroides albus]|uniref:hypothetical protein n=1 Tax=Myroides albus TaxID=2562892 RepID=UPI002159376C|nr:hypothetical protein [Myroides albus]UVD78229.1 hypothetical protein NWE55_08710 [Myroides albus]